MSVFKKGDRVHYIGNTTASLIGDVGVVVCAKDADNIGVRWVNKARKQSVYSWNLRHAPAEPARIATPAEMAGVHRNVLPTDAAARNAIPLADGLLYYFPNGLAAVSALSKVANEQHNPGEPMHWARNKSHDHANKILKHLVDAGGIDIDGQRHSAKVAWRALALLEDELIAAGAVPGRNAIGSPEVLRKAHHNCIEDEV
jgi:hypothetical protein